VSSSTEDERGIPLLLDTHVLLWLIGGYGSLSVKVRGVIQDAANIGCALVSAITPWEIALLVSKKRLKLDRDVLAWMLDALAMPGISQAALAPEIAVASTRLPFEMHADPADRILVATARHLGATLVTADRALLEMAKSGHFRAMDATV
jgi:PIN domain nuclease of toxin-antitoxin system